MKTDFKKTLKEFKDINSKLIKHRLKTMLSEETFSATKKDTGKISVFKSKEARDAAIKAGTHTKIKDKKDKPTSKGNIFEPEQDGDVENQSKSPKAEKTVNKIVKSLFDKSSPLNPGPKLSEWDEIRVIRQDLTQWMTDNGIDPDKNKDYLEKSVSQVRDELSKLKMKQKAQIQQKEKKAIKDLKSTKLTQKYKDDTEFAQFVADKSLEIYGGGLNFDYVHAAGVQWMKEKGLDPNDHNYKNNLNDMIEEIYYNKIKDLRRNNSNNEPAETPGSTKRKDSGRDLTDFVNDTASEYKEALENEGESAAMDVIDTAVYDYMDEKGLDPNDEEEYDKISDMIWDKLSEGFRFNKRLLERAGIKRKK